MKWMKRFQNRLTGLTNAISRFPLTTLFLLGAAIITSYMITVDQDNPKYLLTFIVGAFISAVAQVAYERFYSKQTPFIVLMGLSILLTGSYFLTIMNNSDLSMETTVRTIVALFALFIAFIWVPVIQSEISFNASFMAAFKAFFTSLFFSGVIYGGISIIFAAFDQLIFPINYKVYPQTANIIFILFAPIYFLSLIPRYPGVQQDHTSKEEKGKQKESIEKSSQSPKFLQVLISYISIPLTAIFTLILVLYIVKNIGGDFWSDNLLEPMLVSYAITVIFVYILASEMDNKFAAFFRKVFPKVLVPIVIFQIISSFITISEKGVTHDRYYVILFGFYAAIAGVILSFITVRKTGIIAAILIVFSAISVIPPVDAFTVSRSSQINLLKDVLEKNNMLEQKKIIPKDSLSDKDKQTITETVNYLDMMEYTRGIEWFPKKFNAYNDFQKTFGFNQFQNPIDGEIIQQPLYLMLDRSTSITITGYDTLVQTDYSSYNKEQNEKISSFKKDGKTYQLLKDFTDDDQFIFTINGTDEQELISFNTNEIYNRFTEYNSGKNMLTLDEATFTKENEQIKLTIVVQNANFETVTDNQKQQDAQLMIFIQIK